MASLLTIIVVNHKDRLGGIPRNLVRCYAVAPARCMSLNLAVKYADVIHSVILQVSVKANSKLNQWVQMEHELCILKKKVRLYL